jgi:hypothetical protein
MYHHLTLYIYPFLITIFQSACFLFGKSLNDQLIADDKISASYILTPFVKKKLDVLGFLGQISAQ